MNSRNRHLTCQGAPFSLLLAAQLQTPSTQVSKTMDPNLALSLLPVTPATPPNKPSQSAPPTQALTANQNELHTRGVQSGGVAATAQQVPVLIPPATWHPAYRRGFIYRAEDLICPRCAPRGRICDCSPPGSGNPKTIKISDFVTALLR